MVASGLALATGVVVEAGGAVAVPVADGDGVGVGEAQDVTSAMTTTKTSVDIAERCMAKPSDHRHGTPPPSTREVPRVISTASAADVVRAPRQRADGARDPGSATATCGRRVPLSCLDPAPRVRRADIRTAEGAAGVAPWPWRPRGGHVDGGRGVPPLGRTRGERAAVDMGRGARGATVDVGRAAAASRPRPRPETARAQHSPPGRPPVSVEASAGRRAAPPRAACHPSDTARAAPRWGAGRPRSR
jgi:hypothetical protein